MAKSKIKDIQDTMPDSSESASCQSAPEEFAPSPPVADAPIVAEAATDVGDLDDSDIDLLKAVLDLCNRRKVEHRKRVKQARLFQELWDKAYWAHKFLLDQ